MNGRGPITRSLGDERQLFHHVSKSPQDDPPRVWKKSLKMELRIDPTQWNTWILLDLCVKFVPKFTKQKPTKWGRNFTYLEDPGIVVLKDIIRIPINQAV